MPNEVSPAHVADITHIKRYEKASFFGFLLFVMFLSSGYTTAILYNGLLISTVAWGIKIAKNKLNWCQSLLNFPIFILLLLSLISSIFSPDPLLSLKSFWKLIQGVLLFFLIFQNPFKPNETKKLIIVMIIAASVSSAISLIFYAFDYRLTYDGRLLGMFKHQNDLAAYLMMILPLSAGVFVSLFRSPRRDERVEGMFASKFSWLYMISFGLGIFFMFSCLVLTYTRGAWVSVFIAICALAIYFERKLMFAIMALILILPLLAPDSAKARFLSIVHHKSGFMGERPYWWGAATKMIYNRPILGIGAGRFKEEYKFFKPPESIDTPEHAHNVYLQIASEYGVLAALSLLSVLAIAFGIAIKASLNCEDRFDLGIVIGIFAALISWCVYGLVDNTLHRRTALFFWFIMGIVADKRRRVAVAKLASWATTTIALIITILTIASDNLASADAKPVGMFNVYFSVDEAIGYINVRDDIAEVKEAGINLITHYFIDENVRTSEGKFWYGLDSWLASNPDKADELNNWRLKYGYNLGWRLFFWSRYLQEAYSQGQGEVKVLVGEMYGMFASMKNWDDLRSFVIALCQFETKYCPDMIAGWYIAEEPTSIKKRYSPELCQEVMEKIRQAEAEIKAKRHPFYLDTTAYGDEEKIASFIKGVDVVMISPDAYMWATQPPTYVEEAQYENIPHAVKKMRELAYRAQNPKASIHIVLQAYDWNKEGPLQPDHLNMHQQVRYALQGGIANRGEYGLSPSWVEPPEGIWLWWWHDVKSEKRLIDGKGEKGKLSVINRWDDGTEGSWKEAIKSEILGKNGSLTLNGNEIWSGNLHIIGDVIVSEIASLKIKPGAKVKFTPTDHFRGGSDLHRCELIIKGKLIVENSAKDSNSKDSKEPIVFSSDSLNKKMNPFPRSPKNRDWYGIRLERKKNDHDFEALNNLIIEHAVKPMPEKAIRR